MTLAPFALASVELVGPPPWRFVVALDTARVGIPLRVLVEVLGAALTVEQMGAAEGFARSMGADPEALPLDAATAVLGLVVGLAGVQLDPSALGEVRAAFGAAETHARELVGRAERAALAVPPSPPGLTPKQVALRTRILEVLEDVRWNRGRAAEILEMPRRTLYRRFGELGIPKGKPRGGPPKKAARKPARTKAPR